MIWNRCNELFPRQKKFSTITIARNRYTTLLNAHYGKRQKEARLWCEAGYTMIATKTCFSSLKRLKVQTKKSKIKLTPFTTTW